MVWLSRYLMVMGIELADHSGHTEFPTVEFVTGTLIL